MNSRQKIKSILKRIKDESEINADPNTIRFDFNNYVVGAGILSADEEIRILSKLQNKGWIRLNLPTDDTGIVTSNTADDYMKNRDYITMQLLPRFCFRYKLYSLLTLFTDNKWNYVNPFWLLWQIILVFWFSFHLLIRIVFKHWFISTLLGLLIIDYTLAGQNVLAIFEFFAKIF